MTRKGRRLTLIGLALGVLGVSAGLALYALRDNVVFFYGPSEVAEKAVPPGTRLRIGGLVVDGSVVKTEGQKVTFAITDMKKSVSVTYYPLHSGPLPDLFREGQGVVAEGTLVAPGELRADTILAKHDENYMPREVADALKKQGLWHEGDQTRAAAPGATATR
jgi:cytochrome c-type biogenesis protein CcmE